MNKYLKYFLSLIFVFFINFQFIYTFDYQISYHIKDIEKYIETNNLFVFDIDQTILDSYVKNSDNHELEVNLNVVIKFMTKLAFKKYKSEFLQKVYDNNVSLFQRGSILKIFQKYIKKRVEDKVFNPQGQIYSKIFVKPVEKKMLELINKIKNLDIKILIFTARPWKSREITLKQLDSLGIDITESGIYDQEIVNRTAQKDSRFGYKDCVLFSMPSIFSDDKVNKGKILIAFFNAIDYKPIKKVIFVDDKKQNILSAMKSFKENDIKFEAIWYKACKTYVNFKLNNKNLNFLDSVWGENWRQIDLDIDAVVDHILNKLNKKLRYKKIKTQNFSNFVNI
ncbi:MAG: DUF2608 domain-containing protein [Candidatus Babeliales bacterium]